MDLVITVRREVPDVDEAKEAYELVKQHLADRPELKITGHVTNHFELGQEPVPPG